MGRTRFIPAVTKIGPRKWKARTEKSEDYGDWEPHAEHGEFKTRDEAMGIAQNETKRIEAVFKDRRLVPQSLGARNWNAPEEG